MSNAKVPLVTDAFDDTWTVVTSSPDEQYIPKIPAKQPMKSYCLKV